MKNKSSPTLGAGSLKAALRQGLKEVSQVLPAFPDSIKVVEEPGQLGNLTPQEIVEQKEGRDFEPES